MFDIYGTPNCPWCDRAKKLLDDAGYKYEYTDVTEDLDAQKMFKDNKFRTVPQVFYGITHIGGYEDLKQFLDSNPEI